MDDKSRDLDPELDFTEEEEAIMRPNIFTPKLSDELRLASKVAQQYKAGVSATKIMKDNNISAGKMYEILRKKGVPLRSNRYATKSTLRTMMMTEQEKNSLIADYQSGVPLETIYNKYKINKNGCYSILDEANVARREKTGLVEQKPKKRKTKRKGKKKAAEKPEVIVHLGPVEAELEEDCLYITIKAAVVAPTDKVKVMVVNVPPGESNDLF